MAQYDQPQEAKDEWTKGLYKKHGLETAPTMEQIEPIAVELLADVTTALEGAELVLGRSIDAGSEEDKTIREIALVVGALNPKHAVAMLIFQRGMEEYGS